MRLLPSAPPLPDGRSAPPPFSSLLISLDAVCTLQGPYRYEKKTPVALGSSSKTEFSHRKRPLGYKQSLRVRICMPSPAASGCRKQPTNRSGIAPVKNADMRLEIQILRIERAYLSLAYFNLGRWAAMVWTFINKIRVAHVLHSFLQFRMLPVILALSV